MRRMWFLQVARILALSGCTDGGRDVFAVVDMHGRTLQDVSRVRGRLQQI